VGVDPNRKSGAWKGEIRESFTELRSALCGKGRKTPPPSQTPWRGVGAENRRRGADRGSRTVAVAVFRRFGADFGEHCVGNTNLLEKAPPVTASNSTRLSACHTRPASRSAVATEGCAGRAGVGERCACALLSTLARRAPPSICSVAVGNTCYQSAAAASLSHRFSTYPPLHRVHAFALLQCMHYVSMYVCAYAGHLNLQSFFSRVGARELKCSRWRNSEQKICRVNGFSSCGLIRRSCNKAPPVAYSAI